MTRAEMRILLGMALRHLKTLMPATDGVGRYEMQTLLAHGTDPQRLWERARRMQERLDRPPPKGHVETFALIESHTFSPDDSPE